ncbi:cytochrome P450 2B2-like isoform X2 [Saccostrea cucullata]|uniref:cytochrome P450 2B2-like isoform X2 n=1 Tax=Saccostrea cuccullata TaxID=36930 RepID=UPI002ED153B5
MSSRCYGNLPPREPGYPLIGNVGFKAEIPEILNLWQKHGDLFTLKVFGQTIIVACGHQTLHEMLEKHGEYCCEHPCVYGYTEYFESSGIIGAFENVWYVQRKFLKDTLTSIDSGGSNLETHVANEVPDFINHVENSGGQPFSIDELLKKSHYNIVSSIIFGKRFELGDATLTRLVELVYESTINTPDQAVLSFFEWMKYLPGDCLKVRRQRYLIDQILAIIQQEVDEHKKVEEKPNSTDLIYSFFKEQERRKQSNENLVGFQDRDLLLMGYGLLLGSIGGILALQWAVLYLMHHPKVVSRMQREIEENVGNSRPPTMADKPRLPYCQAVMYEVLRAASVIQVSPTHCISTDLTINGYHLKKDSWILFAFCTVNMDPSIFKEPETFNPDRFINEDGQVFGFEKVNVSFSIGPHR